MSVLMFINLKGGVAKTTNAVAVAEFLAEEGHRVLLIDADHQCAAGELLLGGDELDRCDRRKLTLHDLFRAIVKRNFNTKSFADYVVPAKSIQADDVRLWVLPSSIRIDEYQSKYNEGRKEFRSTDEFHSVCDRRLRNMRKWLQSTFDFTIIDCPPSLSIQVQMLVKVSHGYIVPTIPDKLSVRGCEYLIDRFRRKNFKLPGLGTLWSLYREQNSIHQAMVQLVNDRPELFPGMPEVFETVIPNATAIARAMESPPGSLNAKYSPQFAHKYRQLIAEIVRRCDEMALAN